jgi:cold shock CspA family protein
MTDLQTQTGRVVNSSPRGFAFVKPDNGGADCYVHHSILDRVGSLAVGDHVQFQARPDRFGRTAPFVFSLTVLERAADAA